MQHAEHLTLAEMREFLIASSTLSFAAAGRKQIYGLVERVLRTQQYLRLSKKDKGVLRHPNLRATEHRHDVSPDGWRFVLVEEIESEKAKAPLIHVVQNWFEEFRDREKD